MASSDIPIALVLRFPGRIGRGIKALSQRGPWQSLSDMAVQALRLRLAFPADACMPTLGFPSHGAGDQGWGGTARQIKFLIPRQLAEQTRVAARERGVATACLVLEGVALLLAVHHLPWPSRGICRLQPGRPSTSRDDMPIVVLDDGENCCAVA